ncbi:MAG: GDSL-type esterase/lipase family protein [Anaerolineae bacterium]
MKKLFILLMLIVLLLTPAIPASAAQPEAAASATTWKYVALGDSLAVGVGSSSCFLAIFSCNGYVSRYKTAVQSGAGVTVSLSNLGQSGWTSTNLLNALKTNSSFINGVKAAQVVTIDIGGNDLKNARDSYKKKTCGGTDNQNCLRTAVATFKSNYLAILNSVLTLRGISNTTITNTVIRTMDVYNPYVGADSATNTWSDTTETAPYKGNDFIVFKAYLDDANKYVADTATAKNIPYARVYATFNGSAGTDDPVAKGWIYSDGLHPNDTGYQKIADQFAALNYAPLH